MQSRDGLTMHRQRLVYICADRYLASGDMEMKGFVAIAVLLSLSALVQARQDDVNRRIDELTRKVAELESRPQPSMIVHQQESTGGVLFLFGVFCALWAQNTNRNPWLWFFLGLIFSMIAGLVLLWKNSEDRKNALAGR
jgi:hypothetical protein